MTIREEYCEKAKKLLSNERSIFDCAEDVMFTIYLRECFLTIRGDLNSGIKTKGMKGSSTPNPFFYIILFKSLYIINLCNDECAAE